MVEGMKPADDHEDACSVVLGEDDVLFRAGLVHLMAECGIHVLGQAASADELIRKVNAHRPDVVVTDIRMPPGNRDDGLQAALQIRKRYPTIGVVVLSKYISTPLALKLICDNAAGVGYLLKDRVSNLQQFADAVRRVAQGGSALDPEVVSRLVGRVGPDPLAELSPREREVLSAMAQGLANEGIASALVITAASVEKHVRNIMRKLDLPPDTTGHRRVLAVLAFLRSIEEMEHHAP
jgi:DNA-binding NarL/FixJ family response regulator